MNPWKTFVQLIAADKKWIAKVIATNSTTKKVTVQEIGTTGSVLVESTGTIFATGSYVFVEGTKITGQAPNVAAATKQKIY